ncbi:hypothetical protein D3C87_1521500 [compost metagenome]
MDIDFEPRPSRVIHQKKTGPVVGSQIAGADVLSVAAIIGKGQSSLINDFEKTGIASTMLNVGPARFRDRCHIEAVTCGDESDLVFCEGIGGTAIITQPDLVHAHGRLSGSDAWRHGDFKEMIWHVSIPC